MTTAPRILVIDDDDDFVQSLRALLEREGYAVLHAPDGQEGVLQARRTRPDLIVVDVMMQERTEGFFVVQELRRVPELAGTPIFVVSAVYERTPEFDVPPASDWMAHDGFFPKPIDATSLLDAVRTALATRSHADTQGDHR
ncbi:MAG: response regulator [Gemmatimonadota bacterium]|nr:response regulator [Gemmatimonadota bacterium]